MNYKIIVDNHAHKRYINYGIKTHEYNRNENIINNKIIHIITTKNNNNFNNIKNIRQSLVILDSASILGSHFDEFIQLLKSDNLENIYIVGNTCLESDFIKNKTNIKLLYKQDVNKLYEVLNSDKPVIGLINSCLSGMLYFGRDIVNHPRIVFKILTNKKTLLFAGQDGESSIINILNSHIENIDDLENTKKYLSLSLQKFSYNINKYSTANSISNYIIALTKEFSDIIERTDYAINQIYFRDQRTTILFKSFFRFFMLKYLESKEILTVIKFPKEYLRIYNSKFYNRNYFVDFGGVNGYESLYPRMADIIYNKLQYFQFNQDELRLCQFKLDSNNLETYITTQIDVLNNLIKLN